MTSAVVEAPSENIVDRTLNQVGDRVRGPIIGLMRIAAGVLWLANIEWKRPPNFGQDRGNGLYKYVNSAVKHPVLAPFSWFIEHVVMKQYKAFGWITLITEVALAACLMLGLHTRLFALIGAAMSVNILLSVLNYVEGDSGVRPEWAWSYYLMIALHLVLFAIAAGQHLGIDGVRRRGAAAKAQAVRVLGVVAVVVGVIGLILALKSDFSGKIGHTVGYAKGKWELKLIWLNGISSLLTIAFGVLALASSVFKKTLLAWIAVAGFALMALQVLVQWRSTETAYTGGFLGSTGGTLAFWTMLALGIGTCIDRGNPAT
jgi:thiosulfate dehydrogenase (quinone) large subunit